MEEGILKKSNSADWEIRTCREKLQKHGIK
jgi:hypothetical protein